MKYCTNCGVQLSDDARFCPACGTKQEAAKAPAAEPVPPKPKSPTASKKQTTQAKVPQSQANNSEGYQEEFFIASDSSGEEVISSWDEQRTAPPAQRTATAAQRTATSEPTTVPPAQRTATAAQRTATSEPTTAPPDRRTATPAQRTVPPAQRTVAPVQKKKKRGFFGWVIIILLILITLYFLGSLLEGCRNANLPPDPGTPEPEPLSGIFVCNADSLFFNGDGKSVRWHFADTSEEFNSEKDIDEKSNSIKNPADKSNSEKDSEKECSAGKPASPECLSAAKVIGYEGEGLYTFLFSKGKARYDVAERLLISDTVNHISYTFVLPMPASDTLIHITGACSLIKIKN